MFTMIEPKDGGAPLLFLTTTCASIGVPSPSDAADKELSVEFATVGSK